MSRDASSFIAAAKRLRERRVAVGMTAVQVADRLGVDAPRYRYWEKVFGPLPQRQYGDAIGRILGVDARWFCAVEGEASTPFIADHDSQWLGSDDGVVSTPTTMDYDALGQRAKTRRRILKLSVAHVAEAIGVSRLTLSKWEDSLPARHRGGMERLWEDALQVPRGWLRDLSIVPTETALASHSPFNIESLALASVADEIRAVGAWLARAVERSRTVRFDELSDAEQRRAFMFAERYGVSGSGGTVLQVIGDQFGLTRERVRQVVEVMTDRARSVTFTLPCLLRLKEEAATAPMSVADFETKHRILLGDALSLADADRFAREILGFSVASMTERSLWQTGNAVQAMLSRADGLGLAVAARDASRRMIRSCGAAHAMFVTGMVSAALGVAISINDVRHVLSAIEGMEWLTEDEDWYWFGMDTANNRVLDVARKVLTVAHRRLDIEELHQAVCRSRRILHDDRTSPPAIEVPKHVLREIFVRVPWLSVVQHNDFVLTDFVLAEEILNSSELSVVEVVRRYGGAVSRQILTKELVETGIFSSPNLQIVLANSPVIRPLGFGIFGLRGVSVSERALAAAVASMGNHTTSPSSLDSDGWCEFEIEITKFKLQRGLIDFPARVIKVIPTGEYRAEGLVDGNFFVGKVPSAPHRVTKLVSLLRKAGVRPADVLKVRIHPEKLCAEISRGGHIPGTD